MENISKVKNKIWKKYNKYIKFASFQKLIGTIEIIPQNDISNILEKLKEEIKPYTLVIK
jgi:hypothetical protein